MIHVLQMIHMIHMLQPKGSQEGSLGSQGKIPKDLGLQDPNGFPWDPIAAPRDLGGGS